jgi:hypothetical protein
VSWVKRNNSADSSRGFAATTSHFPASGHRDPATSPDCGGKISYRAVKRIDLPSTFQLSNGSTWSPCEDPGDRPQVEGMVFDRTTTTLYAVPTRKA